LALAEPEGYVRIFVDEGVPMRDLLRHAVARGIGGGYAQRLLSASDERAQSTAGPAGFTVAGLAEPLTPREVEILRLIAAGMRNQEIADRLVISLSTVKRHIANTYGKLGVNHRTEAVARLTT
jgi:LuxR family maltose regulon positive regulatory protein